MSKKVIKIDARITKKGLNPLMEGLKNIEEVYTKVGVDSLMGTVSNGLTKTGTDTKLGGSLTENTTISLDTKDLTLSGIGNVDIGLTYATGTAKTFLESGKNVLGLTALGIANGVDGIGRMYMEDPSSFSTSNNASFIMGDMSDFGSLGTGTSIFMQVGDFAQTLPKSSFSLQTDSAVGDALIKIIAKGHNARTSTTRLQSEHAADIAYSEVQLSISGPTGLKNLYLSNDNWGVANSVTGDSYKFPWTNGAVGQVLADNGSNSLEWTDVPGTTVFVSLTYGANIAWAVSGKLSSQVTLTGASAVLDNPTGLLSGRTYNLIVKQDATGSRILTYGSVFKWSGGTVPTLSTGANAIDIFTFIYDGTNLYGSSVLNFS